VGGEQTILQSVLAIQYAGVDCLCRRLRRKKTLDDSSLCAVKHALRIEKMLEQLNLDSLSILAYRWVDP